jgi:hypothetical protein
MLDGIERKQFDEWLAYRELEPDPIDRIVSILRLGLCAVANAWGGKLEPQHIDPDLAREMSEASGQTDSEPIQEVTPNQGAAIVSTVLGAPN